MIQGGLYVSHPRGRDMPLWDHGSVLLLVHERLADQKKKHRKAAHFSALLTGT